MDTGELRLKWASGGVRRGGRPSCWSRPDFERHVVYAAALLLPVYLQELGLPPAAIGGVVAGAQLAGMAVALLGGWVAGMLGSKWVLVRGLALSGVASLAFQVRTPWLMAALWFIGGAGLALITVGGASYLTG